MVYSLRKTGAEKPIEIVAYNLMEYLRKKINKPNLCRKDFTHRQRDSFDKKAQECLEKGIFCENPFNDEERLLMISIEEE